MKYTEAIAAIQASSLENKGDIVAALNSHASELTSDRDKYKKASSESTTQLNAITAAAGHAEGELSDRLASTVKKLQSAEEQSKAQEQESKTKDDKIAELESKVSAMERGGTIGQASSILGANREVLEKLLTAEDKLEISSDGKTVKVNGTDFKDWATTNHQPFIPVLLPEKKGELPSGASNPDNNQPPAAKTEVQQVQESCNWGSKK